MKKRKKVRPVKPYTDKWYAWAGRIARELYAEIIPCEYCQRPKHEIYLCPHCDDGYEIEEA